jgi:hypothetical protein
MHLHNILGQRECLAKTFKKLITQEMKCALSFGLEGVCPSSSLSCVLVLTV